MMPKRKIKGEVVVLDAIDEKRLEITTYGEEGYKVLYLTPEEARRKVEQLRKKGYKIDWRTPR